MPAFERSSKMSLKSLNFLLSHSPVIRMNKVTEKKNAISLMRHEAEAGPRNWEFGTKRRFRKHLKRR